MSPRRRFPLDYSTGLTLSQPPAPALASPGKATGTGRQVEGDLMADKQDGAWFWSKTLTGLGVLVTGLALWGGLSPSGQPDCNGRKMQPGDTCVSSGGQRARSYDEAVADAAGTEQLARTGIVVGPMLLIGGVACLVAFRSRRPSYRW